MMRLIVAYRPAIEKIIVDKSLKLRAYELFNDDPVIIEDIFSVPEVHYY